MNTNPQTKIAELEVEIARLARENEVLQIKLNDAEVFARMLAERIFATDDLSRWYAGQVYQNVDANVAYRNWLRNGGPEAFGAAFPTLAAVRSYFCRLSRGARKIFSARP